MASARRIPTILLLTLATAALSGVQHARAQASDFCSECHLQASEVELRQPSEQVPGSAHGHASIGCVGCHGGDPADPTVRGHASSAGYVGSPSTEQIAAVCGGCHADAQRIHEDNADLPLDQLALYTASRHGAVAAVGDGAAPTCVTCHGHHDTRSAGDSRSRVHPRRVAELCGSCHSDADKMAAFPMPTGQLAQWQRSAHASAFRQGTEDAPTCSGCHGAHGDTPADVASVADGCASCHEQQRDQYLNSPHAEPFQQQGFAPCVPCHGSHDVPAALPLSLALGPDGSCSSCHAKDEQVRASIEKLVEALGASSTRAAAVRTRIARATLLGLPPPEAASALAELDRADKGLRLAIHTLDPAQLEEPLAEVVRVVGRAEKLAAGAESRRRWIRIGTWAGGGFLVVLLTLLVYRLMRRPRRRSA